VAALIVAALGCSLSSPKATSGEAHILRSVSSDFFQKPWCAQLLPVVFLFARSNGRPATLVHLARGDSDDDRRQKNRGF